MKRRKSLIREQDSSFYVTVFNRNRILGYKLNVRVLK